MRLWVSDVAHAGAMLEKRVEALEVRIEKLAELWAAAGKSPARSRKPVKPRARKKAGKAGRSPAPVAPARSAKAGKK